MTVKQYNMAGIALSILSLILLGIKFAEPSGKPHAPLKEPVMSKPSPTPPANKSVHLNKKEQYSSIAANDLFHPLRGKAPAAEKGKAEKQNKPQTVLKFELKGIYHSGNRHGALIVYRGNTKANTQKDLKKADSDLFYLGKEISDGYILQEIRDRSVLIARGNEKLEVELTMLQLPADSQGGASQKTLPETKKQMIPQRN